MQLISSFVKKKIEQIKADSVRQIEHRTVYPVLFCQRLIILFLTVSFFWSLDAINSKIAHVIPPLFI